MSAIPWAGGTLLSSTPGARDRKNGRMLLRRSIRPALTLALLIPGALQAAAQSVPPAHAAEQAGSGAPAPFARGTRVLTATVGTSHDADIGRIRVVQLGAGHYVRDGLALHLGLNLAYADPDEQPNGLQGGPEVGLRWHVLASENWSAYLEGSVAAVAHEHPLTPNSLHFNFDVEGGVGATRRVTDTVLLMGGMRWHHLSNARVRGESRNLGYDAPMLYGGLMRRY